MMRSLPNSYTFRPADPKETAAAYQIALTKDKPICIALTRQKLPLYEETGRGALRGAYVLKDSENPEVLLIGTGSEVEPCVKAYEMLKAEGIAARVVSMPCIELFEEQDEAYKQSVIPAGIKARVAVEAGVSLGWERYVGLDGKIISIDDLLNRK
jgi:transketolase